MKSMMDLKPGDAVTFPIARGGRKISLTVAGYYEDPFMGSSMIGMKGFLISEQIYDEICSVIEEAGMDALARDGVMIHIQMEEGRTVSEINRTLTENTPLSMYKEKNVYHNGYNNYSAFIDEIAEYAGKPDTLLVTGFSTGGFAASLLADDVIARFPAAANITVCVDSSLLLYDGWHDTAVNLWKAPVEISDRLTTDNLVLDSLTALYEKRGDSVKILFGCSYRDDTLQQYQSYINNGTMDKTKELGDQFQENLKEMAEGLRANIPDAGIYIWSLNEDAETHNTQHTIISSNIFDRLGNGKSVCEWIFDAVNGDVQTIGLELLYGNE